MVNRLLPLLLISLCAGCAPPSGQLGVNVPETVDDDDDNSTDDDDDIDQIPGAELLPIAFSHDRGFYDAPFEVEVSVEGEGGADDVEIHYTLDGRDPSTSPDALVASAPATVPIDPYSNDHRDPAPGVTLRACGYRDGLPLTDVVTHTYLFADDAAALSPDDEPPGEGWPEIYDTNNNTDSRQAINYGLDPDVTGHPAYQDLIDDALLAIPTISVVTDLEHLFDESTGIYENALEHGIEWERRASLEWIDPDDDGNHAREIQVNAGIRIRGGWSRHSDNPKHAFRFFFREDYGPGELEFALFEDEGVDRFDDVDLRTSQNYSWSYKDWTGAANTMNRDVYSRDLQRDMGRPYTRSRYYHLYLNGVYWGVFQTQERSEASYAQFYFGGAQEDYDVVKVNGDVPTNRVIEATDGTLDAWYDVWELCQAGFAAQENYDALQGLVDIDNLIDYMIIIFYGGNFDAPTGAFTGNKGPNNFFMIRSRAEGSTGFVFFAHDSEHSLHHQGWSPGIGLQENRVNLGDLVGEYQMVVTEFENFHPQWLHHRLTANADYRARFNERVHQHFFDNGAVTPQVAADRFAARAAELELAIIAESARWGDSQPFNENGRTYRTRDDDWAPEVQATLDGFFLGNTGEPTRTDIVLAQLEEAGLYWP